MVPRFDGTLTPRPWELWEGTIRWQRRNCCAAEKGEDATNALASVCTLLQMVKAAQ